MSIVYFALSQKCNLRCKYCYIDDTFKASHGDMDEIKNGFKAFIDKCVDERFPLAKIVFHGSEPTTISADIYSELMDYANHFFPSLNYGIQTNGTLLKEFAPVLKGRDIHFSVSLDIGQNLHDVNRGRGTYALIVSNLMLLKSLGFRFSVLSVLTHNSSLQDINDHINFMEEHRIKFELKHVHGGDNTSSFENQFAFGQKIYGTKVMNYIQTMAQGICDGQGNHCFFLECDPYGNVYACNQEYGDRNAFSNWKQFNFAQIINKRMNNYVRHTVHNDCVMCAWFEYCNGGCPLTRVNGKASDCGVKLGILDSANKDLVLIKDLFFDRMKKYE